jgi:hypothetical protein
MDGEDWSVVVVRRGSDRRRLRLWAVACSRRILAGLATAAKVPEYYRPEFAKGAGGWRRAADMAEQFADGRTGWRDVVAARPPTGGPWNVFHVMLADNRLFPAEATRTFSAFAAEFGLPTADELTALTRDVFADPVPVAAEWRTTTAVVLAAAMYESRDFGAMPILADALEDAGCGEPAILAHCRGPGPHVRGCWVVDAVLGRTEPTVPPSLEPRR